MKKHNGKKFLSDLKLYSDYLKWREDDGRYETWEEACEDIVDGHRKRFSQLNIEEELQEVVASMKDMQVLASQRNLQFRHNQIMQHNARMFNCSVVHCCEIDSFRKIFYLGLCGCGVGISLLYPFVNCLPKLSKREKGTKTFVIQDSIEGWAEALNALILSYTSTKYKIRFDYSQIREKGAYINGGFKAPGPEGLKASLEKIEKLLDSWIEQEGETIRPILAYDIICHASDAVLSGGVRRSALSMIVDPNDEEMINAKTGNWRQENPQRARSNNSVLIPRNTTNRDFFDKIVSLNGGDNDIGFVFCNTWFDIFNPCYTINTKVLTKDGWKTFKEIIELKEKGEDVYIAQDNRIISTSDSNQESWDINLHQDGIVYNKIGKVGITGKDQDIYKIKLSCGREVEVTGNHKIATTRGMIEAKKLIIGEDQVLLGMSSSVKSIQKDKDFELGFLSGLCVGDGFILDNEAGISLWFDEDCINYNLMAEIEHKIKQQMDLHELKSKGSKPLKKDLKFKLQTQVGNCVKYTLSSTGLKYLFDKIGIIKDDLSWIHKKNNNFQAGLISGLFFADGHVDFNESSRSISLRITQSNKELLKNIMLVLQDFGIMSSVYDLLPEGKRLLPNSDRDLAEYDCKASYRLCIPGAIQMDYMLDNILYLCDNKIEKLKNILSTYKKKTKIKNIRTVVNIEYIGKQDVYCLEENINRTLIAEGISAERCFEIGFTPVNTDEKLDEIKYENIEGWTKKNIKKFGVEFCNLNEINAEKCKTEDEFLKACKVAAILGTLQAAYNEFPFLSKSTEEICAREALLGVSITGWMNNPKLLNPELLQKGAKVVVDTNKWFAEKIGINPAARTTCVKPSGNASVVLGTASGIHPEHSERYFRIMQLNKESDTAKWLAENCDFLLEESVWSANKTDYVVFVPIINPKNGLFKNDMKGVKHLEIIKMVQQNWIIPGTNPERGICDKTTHNCSCTVIIDNKDEVVDYIWNSKEYFTAISFISDYGDKDFNQAPFTSVLNVEEVFEKYGKGALFASGLIVDGLHYFNNNLWEACDCLLDTTIPLAGTREQVMLKKYWLNRAKRFAKNYFNKDLTMLIYCLKDVHLCHKWESITREMREVKFEEILKRPTFKDISDYAAVACHGNSCTITSV